MGTPLPPVPWQILEIPILLPGSRLGSIWTSGPLDAYVWGQRTTPGTSDVPEATLYHWNGSAWSASLSLPGHPMAHVFGTGPGDVYAAANKCATGDAAGCGDDRGGRLWRSTDGGATWTPLTMPAPLGTNTIVKITGTANNIHLRASGDIFLRLTDAGWSTYAPFDTWGWGAFTVFAPNKGYYARCWGWGWWNGNTWQNHADQFDFCDAFAMWGMRAQNGSLHLYVAGDNNWGNGVHVWKFDEASQSLGSKSGYVFGDGNGYKYGRAADIWGAAPDDIYVTGFLGDWDATNPTVGHGRLYHFDGTTWGRITEIGDIAAPSGMSGSSAANLSAPLVDGRILRKSTAPAAQWLVTNTQDSGPGSLRQAISDALAHNSTPQIIAFQIPTSDPGFDGKTFTIRPLMQLPTLLGNVVISGTTQAAFAGDTNPLGPEIVLNGSRLSRTRRAFTSAVTTTSWPAS